MEYIMSESKKPSVRTVKKVVVEKVKAYLESKEVTDKFDILTSPKMKASSPQLVLFNDKNGQFGVQVKKDYFNKMNYKSLSDWIEFLALVDSLDLKVRTVLTASDELNGNNGSSEGSDNDFDL